MPLPNNEFKELAVELIDGDFAEYRRPLVLTVLGTYDPTTETTTADQDYEVLAIRLELDYKQLEAQNIQYGDFNVIFPKVNLPVDPTIANEVTYDGRKCQIIYQELDPADAAWILVLRGL